MLLRHPIISIFGSRVLKVYFLYVLFSKAQILRTLELNCGHTSYRNDGKHKRLVYLTQSCQTLAHKFLPVTLRIFTQSNSQKCYIYFNHHWHRALAKILDYLFT